MSGGASVPLSKMRDLEAEDRVCKVAGQNAAGLTAKEPRALSYLVITMSD